MFGKILLSMTHFLHESLDKSNRFEDVDGLYKVFRRASEGSPHGWYDLKDGKDRRTLLGIEPFLRLVFTVSWILILSLIGLFVTHYEWMVDLTLMEEIPVVPLLSLLFGYLTFKMRFTMDRYRFDPDDGSLSRLGILIGRLPRASLMILKYLPMVTWGLFLSFVGIPLPLILESITINLFIQAVGFQIASFKNKGFDGPSVPRFVTDNHLCVDTGLDPNTYLRITRSLLSKEDRENSGYGGLIDRIRYPLDRFSWYLHFNRNTLEEILDINDDYHSHYWEMRRDGKDIPVTNTVESMVPIVDGDLDSKEPWVSSEILIFLDLDGKEDLDTLRNDPYKISVFLDILESNGRIYHLQWNRNLVELCNDTNHDIIPKKDDTYGSDRVRLFLKTLLPYFREDGGDSLIWTVPLIWIMVSGYLPYSL